MLSETFLFNVNVVRKVQVLLYFKTGGRGYFEIFNRVVMIPCLRKKL